MGNLHLVTGHKGEAHVTPADHASLYAAILGEGEYVLNRGSKFAYTIMTNNSIRIADGDILHQGRHVRLNEGSYVDLAIENGAQGYYRNDLIVGRYTADSTSGVEEYSLVVIKGTAVTSNPVDPEYTSGDIINDHVLISDMPLYRVPLDGLNVQELVPLFSVASPDIADSSVTTEKIANNAVSQIYTAKIGTAWTGDAAPYTQTVTVKGLLSDDKPVIDLLPSDDYSTAEKELEAFSCIYRVKAAANSITVYATEATTTEINIQMMTIRK